MEKIGGWIEKIDTLVWGPWLLGLLLGTGCWLMVQLHFLPFKNLKFALRCAIGMEKPKYPSEKQEEGISSFSSLTTELAATIGTGNIVGVATAMICGGPGALVWMILSSLIGMATKLVESTLAVKYCTKNDTGEIVGGPMYTMEHLFCSIEEKRGVFGKKIGKSMGKCFAFFAVMASFGMGNMTQSNSIAEALKVTFEIPAVKTGLVVTVVTILVVLGGIKSIAKVTQIVVPFMGIFYLAGTICVIFFHIENLPKGILQILVMAFCPQAVTGGLLGNITVSIMDSLRFGVSRGVFSNEAGLGAAGISAAASGNRDYIRQGYISMTGVFLDTIVICSITGLALASSGVVGSLDEHGELLTGTALTIAAFRTTFGELGAYFISVCITLFAFATIIGWAYQGEKAFEYLAGKSKYCIYYRFLYALTAFLGTIFSLKIVWDFSDICNGLMAVPNLICVLIMSKNICKEIREYNLL